MAKRQRGGKSWKGGYTKYANSNKWLVNKIAKLEKHIKEYPEDTKAVKALETIKKNPPEWKRRRPINRGSVKSIRPSKVKLLPKSDTIFDTLCFVRDNYKKHEWGQKLHELLKKNEGKPVRII